MKADIAQQLIDYEPHVRDAYQMTVWCDMHNVDYPKPNYRANDSFICWQFNDGSAVYFEGTTIVRYTGQVE